MAQHNRLALAFLFIMILMVFSTADAQKSEHAELGEREAKILYRDFKDIRSFGLIAISLVGEAEKIGLDKNELTEYVKSRFKIHFAEIRYDDVSKDPRKFLSLVGTRERTVGNITFRIWVVGEEYPLVYHIKCDAGNFENPSIWTEEILGHGSMKSTPPAIKDILEEMMRSLADHFFKARR